MYLFICNQWGEMSKNFTREIHLLSQNGKAISFNINYKKDVLLLADPGLYLNPLNLRKCSLLHLGPVIYPYILKTIWCLGH